MLANLAISTLSSNFPNVVSYWQEHHFVICPIPLHSSRLLWRGFNQSQLLSSALVCALHLGHCPEILVRTRASRPQSTLPSDSSLRAGNIQNSFVVTPPIPSSVILFDDVSTTGSTLLSAAQAFPPQTRLWGLVLASKA
ncbi:MAG: ComF family protein [Candidatus Shapirobacteria bacterium]